MSLELMEVTCQDMPAPQDALGLAAQECLLQQQPSLEVQSVLSIPLQPPLAQLPSQMLASWAEHAPQAWLPVQAPLQQHQQPPLQFQAHCAPVHAALQPDAPPAVATHHISGEIADMQAAQSATEDAVEVVTERVSEHDATLNEHGSLLR
jgi:hypothetical protein